MDSATGRNVVIASMVWLALLVIINTGAWKDVKDKIVSASHHG